MRTAQTPHAAPSALTILAFAVLAGGLPGCSGLDSDPVTLVNHMRVLAIHADPPYIAGPGSSATPGPPITTVITPLVVGAGDPAKLCYAWVLCPFALSKDGNFRCLDERLEVDLGTGDTAKVGMSDALASVSKLKELGDQIGDGIKLPGGGAGGGEAGPGTVSFEFYVQFMISEPRVWGGTCPTNALETLHKVCPQRDGCLAGYSKLAFATSPAQANRNPVLTGLTLDAVDWPASLTPTAAPVAEQDGANPFDLGTAGLAMEPTWTTDSIEVIRPATTDQPEVRESLTFSWFSTNGEFAASKSSQYFADTRFWPASPQDKTDEEVTIWLIARDNRNGLAWMSRRLKVDSKAQVRMHLLCRVDQSLAGCDEAEPCLTDAPPDPASCSQRCVADATLPWCKP